MLYCRIMSGNDLTDIIPGNFTRYAQLEEL